MIVQRFTYMCNVCAHLTQVTSEQREPLINPPDRCEVCGHSMKEARKLNKLKRANCLLTEALDILLTV